MSADLRRIRGALGMGVLWAIGWAIAGVLLGVTSDLIPSLPWHWLFDVFDAPLPAFAIPGFCGGVLFSVVLAIAARRHRFHELSLPQFAAWGALGGLMVGLIPAALVGVRLATLATGSVLWHFTVAIAIPLTALGAVSASASLLIARAGSERSQIDQGDELIPLESSAPK